MARNFDSDLERSLAEERRRRLEMEKELSLQVSLKAESDMAMKVNLTLFQTLIRTLILTLILTPREVAGERHSREAGHDCFAEAAIGRHQVD